MKENSTYLTNLRYRYHNFDPCFDSRNNVSFGMDNSGQFHHHSHNLLKLVPATLYLIPGLFSHFFNFWVNSGQSLSWLVNLLLYSCKFHFNSFNSRYFCRYFDPRLDSRYNSPYTSLCIHGHPRSGHMFYRCCVILQYMFYRCKLLPCCQPCFGSGHFKSNYFYVICASHNTSHCNSLPCSLPWLVNSLLYTRTFHFNFCHVFNQD